MQIVTANCPACGGVYSGNLTSRFIVCEYCGTRYALGEKELQAMGFTDADGDGFDDHDVAPGTAATDGDTNSDPMPVFAQQACQAFLDDAENDDDSYSSSRKILSGLGIGSGEEVYLIHDDTMFKSGKNGFAITSKGFYCRDMGEKKARFIDWDKFASRPEPQIVDSYVRQGASSIVYFTDNDAGKLALGELCQKLWRHAQRVR